MWLAIRYRRLQALVLLVLAALITACAVLAPLYDRAMQQALTRLTVDAAGVSATAIQLRTSSRYEYGPELADAPPATADQLAGLLPEPARAWFGPRVDGATVLVVRSDQTDRSPVGDLQWRDGACAHLTWAAGGCPRERGDIAVSEADRANYGWRVGSTVAVVELVDAEAEPDDRRAVERLRVTGVYRQVSDPYWADQLLTGASGFKESKLPYRPLHDTWLTAAGTFATSGGPVWLDPTRSVTFTLDRAAVGVDEILRAGPMVTGMVERTRPLFDDLGRPIDDGETVRASVQSDLPAISAAVDRGRRQALVTVPLLMIQLGLLALSVLGLTLAAAVEQRRPEVAVARLRGAGRAGARRLVLAELLPVVLAGVPLGVGAALAAAAVARHTTLRDAAPPETGPGFWLAIVGAALVLTGVTWAVVASGTRDRISLLLRSVPIRARGWSLGATDAVLVAGSATAVVAFATGGLRGPLALAAPALLALIAGVLLAHLVGPVATGLGRRLTARGAYAAALAVLAVARRPVTRRVVTVVSVTSALLVFSTYAVSVGARNRQLAAQRDTGAAMVADLTGSDVARVRAALAGEAAATTVVRITAGGGGFRTTLAVDPEPFSRIALLPDADPVTVPWAGLRVPTGRRLALTGRTLSLRVDATGFRIPTGSTAALHLLVIEATGRERTVTLGLLPTGGVRTLTGPVPCADGCTATGFSIAVQFGTAFSGRVTLGDVRVVGGSTDLPGTAADWRPGVAERHRLEAVAAGPGALGLRMDSDGTATPGVVSTYLPATLPALVTGSAPVGGAVLGDGFNGSNRPMTALAALPRAPAVTGAATIVDMDLLQHWGTQVGSSARLQVWFAAEDPAALARVRARLQSAGVEIAGVRRVSEARAAYDTSVPAWSLQLGVLAAVAGLLLAALVLVLLVASTWRRRSHDLACLAMTGMPRRGLGRVAVGEQLPVVLLAVLVGGGCGLLGAALALPTVPLFATDQPAGTLDLSAPWGWVLAVLAATLVALGLVACLCGAVVAARARLARVREAL